MVRGLATIDEAEEAWVPCKAADRQESADLIIEKIKVGNS
jgi:hypothetical protein